MVLGAPQLVPNLKIICNIAAARQYAYVHASPLASILIVLTWYKDLCVRAEFHNGVIRPDLQVTVVRGIFLTSSI